MAWSSCDGKRTHGCSKQEKQVHCIVDNSGSRKDPEYYVHVGTKSPVHTTSADTGSILTPYFASSLSFLRSLYPGASIPATVSISRPGRRKKLLKESCNPIAYYGGNSLPRPSPISAIVCSMGRLLIFRPCSLFSNSSSPSFAQVLVPRKLAPVYSNAAIKTDVKAPYPRIAGTRPTASNCQLSVRMFLHTAVQWNQPLTPNTEPARKPPMAPL